MAGSDLSEILEFDGLLITDCGLPFSFFNVAFVQRPLKNTEESIERSINHFEGRNLPSLICFPPGLDDITESVLISRGHKQAAPHPGMTLYPIPESYVEPMNLEMRTVSDEKELELFQATA